MRRRRFLQDAALLAATTAAASCNLESPSNKPRLPVVGFFPHDLTRNIDQRAAFLDELQKYGYEVGKTLRVEWRLVEGESEVRAYEVAKELLALPVHVLVTNGAPSTRAAKRATTEVPVVFLTADPVEHGLVASLSRPGSNLTGVARLNGPLAAKRLELLKELVPSMSRVAIIGNDDPETRITRLVASESVRALGFHVINLEIPERASVRPALDAATAQRAEALISLGLRAVEPWDDETIKYAIAQRIPALYGTARWVDWGGLAFYGHRSVDNFRRAGTFVARILQGATPAELPVEVPTAFELWVNLKTAAQIGVSIPPSLLARATKVVQ